ncbi:MAG: hypothetical protein HFE71_08540 [Emergencia sp.]|jgi:hypothetical protein|nr:hypothetical protein [Emergencia sp.]
MLFPNVYTKNTAEITSSVGSSMQPSYKMTVEKDGQRVLKHVGETDLYAEIQSHKDSCDINYILQRFAQGDQTALSKIQGVYGDFTQMPTTLAELQQRVVDAESLFYNLPVDVRAEFNHSPSEFYAQIGTDKFNSIFASPEKPEDMLVDGSQVEKSIPIEKEVISNE